MQAEYLYGKGLRNAPLTDAEQLELAELKRCFPDQGFVPVRELEPFAAEVRRLKFIGVIVSPP
jgi:hypothetical protein